MNENNTNFSVGFLLLQGMAAMYNQNSYTQDLVYEFTFKDTAEKFQLQVFRNNCIVATDNFLNFTVRIETTLDNLQKLSDSLASEPISCTTEDCKIEGDSSALKKLPELFSPSIAINEQKNDIKRKPGLFVLHAPIISLWLGVLVMDFWGAVLIVLTALSAVKFLIKGKYPILNYVALAVGVIAGLLCIKEGVAVYAVPLAYIALGIILLISCLNSMNILTEYIADVFDKCNVPPKKIKQIYRVIEGGWGVLFILFGIFITIYQSNSSSNELVVYAVVFSVLLWIITRYIMTTFYQCKKVE